MSYSCDFSFKQMPQSQIMPFLLNFKKEFTKHLKEVASEIFIFCPKLQNRREVPDEFVGFSLTDRQNMKQWFANMAKYKFFYNEELGLLGMSGVPRCLEYLFDGTVHFQNSTDQDYHEESYGNIIPFLDIYFKWNNIMFDAGVKEAFFESRNRNFDDEYADLSSGEKVDKLNYYRRTFCYEEIWAKVDSYLWNAEDQIYFSLFSVTDNELVKLFKYCHDAYLNMDKELI